MVRVWRAFCCSMWLVAAIGCSEDPGGIGSLATRIVVTPVAASVRHGETLRLRAEAYDARDRVLPNVKMVWTSRDTLVAIVSEDGLVYGRAPGSGMLSVRSGIAITQVAVSVSP